MTDLSRLRDAKGVHWVRDDATGMYYSRGKYNQPGVGRKGDKYTRDHMGPYTLVELIVKRGACDVVKD